MALKNQSYSGWCEQWVENYTGAGNKGSSAQDAWNNQSNDRVSGLNGVQEGDPIYFSDPSNPEGHVGIATTNGNFISATYNGIQVENIADWEKSTGQQVLGYIPRNKFMQGDTQTQGTGTGGSPQTVQVRNNKTGQVTAVPVSELSNYGFVGGGASNANAPAATNIPTPSASDIAGATLQDTIQTFEKNKQAIAQGQMTLSKDQMDLLKDQAPELLKGDVKKGMTLKDALATYGPLSVSGDQILSVYDSNSPNGKHKETRAKLLDMGFNNKDLDNALPKLSSADEAGVESTVTTLNTVDDLTNQIKNNKSLNNLMGDPAKVGAYNWITSNVPGGQAVAQKLFGLDDNAINAISEFTKLMASGDRQLIGGRLSGYMTKAFGPAQPNINQTPGANLKLLQTLRKNITDSTDVVANNMGYGSWNGLPGMEQFQNQGVNGMDMLRSVTPQAKDPAASFWNK